MSHDEQSDTRRNGQSVTAIPDSEVRLKAKQLRFTAEYKNRILDEADACTQPSQGEALLRREGLYSSLLSHWRCLQRHVSEIARPTRDSVLDRC